MPPIDVIITIATDGTIQVGPIDPTDYERVKDEIMSMMRNMGSTVVETPCIPPDEIEAMVRRLVDHLLVGGVR
ncbi:MAG: hypothetical protein ACRELB_00755 [Polyangiaceae bacterium]